MSIGFGHQKNMLMAINLDWHVVERGKTLAYKEVGKDPVIVDELAAKRAVQEEITRLNEELNRHFKLMKSIEKASGRVSKKGEEY